jgi:hypothetical protein
MKLFALLLAAVMSAGMVHAAENLVKNFDFNAKVKNLGGEFRANGGKIALFTEENGNRCGQLIVTKLQKSGQYDLLSASTWIGGSYKTNDLPGGFVCKPNTTYDFSIDIKGTAKSANIKMTYWPEGKKLWYGKTSKTTVTGVKVTGDWQTITGSFTTPADALNAALSLSIWENSRWAPLKSKAGDYLLFDNISIKERKTAEVAK